MRIYSVYVHRNKINGKQYFGLTKQSPEMRWKNGLGYQTQERFYRAIQKYGWDNFEHIVLYSNLISEAKKGKCFGSNNNNFRSVNQLDLSGTFIRSWDSLADVERQLKICKANICRAIKYGRTAGGFKWEYINT